MHRVYPLSLSSMFKLFRKLFQPRPEIKVQHEELGLITLDGSLWTGAVLQDKQEIQFFLGGTSFGPDERIAANLQKVIADFPQLDQSARLFLAASQNWFISGDSFKFCSIVMLGPKSPERYYFEYHLAGDEYGSWRVEFEGIEPKYIGRDD